MSDSLIKGSPYYDRFDPSSGYIQLLAVPGRVAQAREFTELQTSLRHIIKSVGDSVLKNGDIIEGCQIIISGKTVKVTPGKVYMDGMVLPIELNYTEGEGENKLEYATVTIKGGVGVKEIIGVKVQDTIITEASGDLGALLRDPAQGHENYNQPGCHRLRRTLKVVVDDNEAAPIATLINGELMVETYAPEYDTLTQTLARRTYDESGSYIVDGLQVTKESLTESDSDAEYYNIVVRSGKAYILGYELKIPTDRRIPVCRSRETTSRVSANTIRYYNENTYHTIESNLYVHSITQVSGSIVKLGLPMTRVPTADEDLIVVDSSEVNDTNTINGVIEVRQGDTKYIEGTDYQVVGTGSSISIRWLEGEGSKRPTSGSYTVDCTMNHIFNPNDYILTYEENGVKGSYLKWTGSQYPANNTSVHVNYKIYLARKDIVYIDRYGNIEVLEGKPGIYGYEAFPEVPLNTLVLAKISNPPNGTAHNTEISEAVDVSSIGLKRFTMNDIQNLLNRVQTMEHDQAVITLNDDARQSYTVNDKKGIFTDPLIDVSRIDFYYNLASDGFSPIDISKPIYNMALDLVSNICYLPVNSNKHDLSFDDTDIVADEYKYNRLISLRKLGERTLLSQTNATTTFQVNPYTMFPQVPEITIDPAVDSWFDDTIIEIPISLNDTEVITLSNKVLDLRLPGTVNNRNWSTRSRTYTRDTAIGTKTDTMISESVVNETAVTYIRPRTITVEGTDFEPGLSNIRCYFDGVLVKLSSTTHAISSDGAVTADDAGNFTATFTIPENRLTGTREVLVKSDEPSGNFVTEASALYVAQGIARRIERTVTTVTTVLLERVSNSLLTSVYVDPVGQSFVLDNMTLLKGINVYFASKPADGSNTPIVCEVREVINGNITHTVYAHASLRPSDIEVDPEKGLKATRFNFSDPVLLEENKEYAFTLRSNSTAYRVWVSELGQVDRATNDLVIRNSYIKGVMFSSSNNSTWTSHQTTDMKFDLIEDIYATNSEINFVPVELASAARLYLSAESAIPPNTAVEWFYKLSGEERYTPITPYNITLLDKLVSSPATISLRATLLNNKPEINLSPLIALDTLMLEESYYSTKGCYISQPIDDLDEYTEVKVVLDTYTPKYGQSTFNIWISTDDGKSSKVPLSPVTETVGQDKVVPLGNDWYQRTYKASLDSPATKCKLFIEVENHTGYATPAFRKIRCIMSGVN